MPCKKREQGGGLLPASASSASSRGGTVSAKSTAASPRLLHVRASCRAQPIDYPPMVSATAAAVTNMVAPATLGEYSTCAVTDPLVVLAPSVGAEPGDEVGAVIGVASDTGAGVPVHPHVNEMSASLTSANDSVPSKSPGPKQHPRTVERGRDAVRPCCAAGNFTFLCV